ncbi:MAG: TolC family protein [Sedimentisphaerales bacterium]|nr:TolC family protein [Sedimentisphaerales bacterium]
MKRYAQTCFGMGVGCLRILSVVLLLLLLVGCHSDPEQVSRETDEYVYEIIDHKWEDSFGSRSDYQIEPFSLEKRYEMLLDISETEVLTLPRAVELAVLHSDEYQTAKEQLYLSTLDLRDARHLYELTPYIGAVGGYAKEGDRETSGGQNQSGIQQLLATGAAVSSGITVGYLDVLTGDFRSGLSTIFHAAITQPLLRGSNRKVVLETLTQAEQDTLYEIRTFNRFRQTFMVSVVTDYFRLLQLYDYYSNAQAHYERLVELTDKMQNLAAVGRLPEFELEQARQDKLRALDEYYQAHTLYQEQLDIFKMKLEIPPDTKIRLDQNEWQGLLESDVISMDWSEEEAVAAALGQRLDLANAFDQALDAQRHVEVAADALQADLDLVGFYSNGNDSSRRYTFGADPGDLNRVRDRYELTLRMDLPLDRVSEKNDYKRALIQLSQRQRNHMNVTDQVIFEVRKAYRDLKEAQEQYANQLEAWELAGKRLDNTMLLLSYGRADARDVLDAQKDYFRTQNVYSQALVDYSVAKLNIYRDSGVLWIQPNGRWEAKTTVKNR